MNLLVHICPEDHWRAAEYRPASLESEGFIHLSRPEQALDTANRYYHGQQGLVLLWVEAQALTAELRWEAAHGEIYPHLYGPLNPEAVRQVSPFPPGADGSFCILPSPPDDG